MSSGTISWYGGATSGGGGAFSGSGVIAAPKRLTGDLPNQRIGRQVGQTHIRDPFERRQVMRPHPAQRAILNFRIGSVSITHPRALVSEVALPHRLERRERVLRAPRVHAAERDQPARLLRARALVLKPVAAVGP